MVPDPIHHESVVVGSSGVSKLLGTAGSPIDRLEGGNGQKLILAVHREHLASVEVWGVLMMLGLPAPLGRVGRAGTPAATGKRIETHMQTI